MYNKGTQLWEEEKRKQDLKKAKNDETESIDAEI